MSLILALDSSTDACSVALSVHGRRMAHEEMAAKSHTQRLLPMVDELLQQATCGLDDIDAIAFGRGPGSFTGLRICMGIVQGLAMGANLPVIPVSTLSAMALGYYRAHTHENRPLLVALDARMGEVYWSLFRRSEASQEEGAPIPLCDEFVMKPEDVCEHHSVKSLQGGFIGVGPGWQYAGLAMLSPDAVQLDSHPRAEDILLIAQQQWAEGKAINVLDAQPVYLRDSVSWQKRQRIRSTT